MRECRRLAVAVVLAAAAAVASAAPAYDGAIARRLIASALEGRSLDDTRELTQVAGARVTGSRVYATATEWAVRRFREAGVAAVHLEPFQMPHAWERAAPASARIVSPVEQSMSLAALGWTP